MKTKITMLLVALFLMSATCMGCYSYVGLDNMTIVAGIAIDISEEGEYLTTVEMIDVFNSSKDTGLRSLIVESKGSTVFEAIRNARLRIPNKLYFGNNSLIILSQKLVSEYGMNSIADFFVRDEECRETVDVVVSGKETAAEILKAKGMLSNITSYAIESIIESDDNYADTIYSTSMYEIYNFLLDDIEQMCLPVISTEKKEDEEYVKIDGMAVFKKDKVVGLFDVEESRYCLFITNHKKGGIIVLDKEEEKISLEISKSRTKIKYEYLGEDKFVFNIRATTDVYIGEREYDLALMTEDEVSKIAMLGEEIIKANIEQIVKKTQSEYNSDLFGFNAHVFRRDPKLWKNVKDRWDGIFPDIAVVVECKVNILNTANIK